MGNPEDLKYSTDHEWVRVDGGNVRIGITEYAQDALGDIVFVQIPEVGSTVSAGATFSEVESTKSVSDIFAPVSGTIIAVNNRLSDSPELVNSDPYGDGWLCEIAMSDPAEVDSLLSASAYAALTS